MTVKEQVFSALRSRKWTPGNEIEGIAPGALRRLRELRADGYEIKSRQIDGGRAHEYRLVRLTPVA